MIFIKNRVCQEKNAFFLKFLYYVVDFYEKYYILGRLRGQ
ncbi:hypothetical protein A45J_0271 [hot springs metagenome]|uniref:Uncharacterized protein n=1 Tax=hot springs metagenome TaxID=433727 RepID=A0A5J4KX67_9ZZZZ